MTRTGKIAWRILLFLAAFVVAWIACGCYNLVVRTEKPYAVAPSPYYCTASVVEDALGAPFRDSSTDPIGDALMTLMWPLWLVDTPCEAVADTVFLPADAIANFVTSRK
jgi:uncharacterized protein YceK